MGTILSNLQVPLKVFCDIPCINLFYAIQISNYCLPPTGKVLVCRAQRLEATFLVGRGRNLYLESINP